MINEIKMMALLKNELKPSRFQHTLGVKESGEQLFDLFPDPQKKTTREQVSIAALLHDCAKNISDQCLLEMAEMIHLTDDDAVMQCSPQLLHGPVGAIVAKEKYGVTDTSVLEAIACHTTGRIGMTHLDKIIFLADYIEAGRIFPGVDELRILSERDLDEGVLAAMTHTICYVAREGGLIHPMTVAARNDLILKRTENK